MNNQPEIVQICLDSKLYFGAGLTVIILLSLAGIMSLLCVISTSMILADKKQFQNDVSLIIHEFFSFLKNLVLFSILLLSSHGLSLFEIQTYQHSGLSALGLL